MAQRPLFLVLPFVFACGSSIRQMPDESRDDTSVLHLEDRRNILEGTTPAGPEVAGTSWRFVEVTCTEGNPQFVSDQFAQSLEVRAGASGLVLVYDQRVNPGCEESVAVEAKPGTSADAAWTLHEQARVSFGTCATQVEADRPGDVRKRGENLEVAVQRSVWCSGYQARFRYAPVTQERPTELGLLRRYALEMNRRDAEAITRQFASNGALVEPFVRTAENLPTRHEGRASIYDWYARALSVPWLALRVTGLERGATPGAWVMNWEYIDTRIQRPFAGRNTFILAGGEIFESTIEVTSTETTTPDDSPVACTSCLTN